MALTDPPDQPAGPAPTEEAPGGSAPGPPMEDPGGDRVDRGTRLTMLGVWLLVAVPLVASLVAFNRPQWHPIADLAQTELRVRDVGTRNSPLVGLAGRIGPWYDPGSHPGPLSFWALAPVYRLLGATAFGLSASALVLHLVALGLSLWAAARRGGRGLVLAVGAASVLLTRAYGAVVLLEPWNPYLPVSWWMAFLLATWSVLDDDPPMLVVAVVAGSFCAQTHLPYLGLVGGFGALLLGASVWWIVRGRPDDPPRARARRVRYLIIALVVGVVLWLPPLIDQVAGTGNLGRIRDTLQDPSSEPIGPAQGAREIVARFGLDGWWSPQDIAASPLPSGWNLTGLVLLATWAVAAVASATGRVGGSALRRLHAVIAVGLVLAFVASSRVNGELWYYLYLWARGLAALTVVAVGWTVALAVGRTVEDRPDLSARLRVGAGGVVVAVAAVGSLLLIVAAPSVEPSRPDLSDDLGLVAEETAVALRSDEASPAGEDGTYLVVWRDPIAIGSQGVGLVNELERDGFDVGVSENQRVGGTRHRVLDPSEADSVLVLAVGPAIDDWEEHGEGTIIAEVDTRTDAERDREAQLSARIDAALEAGGFTERRANWRSQVFSAALDPNLPEAVREDLLAYVDFHAPIAVFAVPPSEYSAG